MKGINTHFHLANLKGRGNIRNLRTEQ